jgi:hypothetical protein
MQFPNEVQAALLFDRRVSPLEAAVRTFMQVEEARTGHRFNVPESKPGAFYRLFGGGELMITLEYIDKPADMTVFQQALGSTVTGFLCPDIRQRLTKTRSHILVNVSHGVLGSVAQDPKIAAMLQGLGMKPEGHSLPQFRRRLEVLALLCRIVGDHAPPQAVHWTQSNQLLPGDLFDAYAASPAPSHLHVHPYLFGKTAAPGGQPHVGIRTFGMRHFIGSEVVIEPSVLPWLANFDAILAFLRVATLENGYIIPDGDTFGPEDGSLSYRVLHREAEPGDVPIYELVPLLHREFGFQADDYVPRDRVFDDRSPPADLMPPDQEAKQDLANEWREKRAMAEGIGGRFEVRARHGDGGAPLSPQPPAGGPPRPGTFGRRPVFGRKGLS